MKIAVFGVGGVGGYFGARLAQHQHEVHLIARGANLEALLSHGLRVSSPDGDFHVETIFATDDPQSVGPVDAVIVAVKGWQLEGILTTIAPLVGPDTLILPLLNGVDATDTLLQQFDSPNLLGGLCGIIAHIEQPGHIRHVGMKPLVKFGPVSQDPHSTQTEKILALKNALRASTIDVEIPDDIHRAIWKKFIFIAPLSGVASLARASIGEVRDLPPTRKMLIAAIEEALAVGQAAGINLLPSDLRLTLAQIDKSPERGTTSMQRDIQAAKPSELDTQTGAVVRLGMRHEVPTPVNDLIHAALLPQEHKARRLWST